MPADSTIPDVFIQEHSIDTGFGSGRVAIAVRAPDQTMTEPVPGAGADPHAELIVPITQWSRILLSDGNNLNVIEVPPGAEIHVPMTRAATEQLTVLSGRMAGYLLNTSPTVP